eukprot:3420233-Pleurochrysis_carterae.AAC.1
MPNSTRDSSITRVKRLSHSAQKQAMTSKTADLYSTPRQARVRTFGCMCATSFDSGVCVPRCNLHMCERRGLHPLARFTRL